MTKLPVVSCPSTPGASTIHHASDQARNHVVVVVHPDGDGDVNVPATRRSPRGVAVQCAIAATGFPVAETGLRNSGIRARAPNRDRAPSRSPTRPSSIES